MTSFTPLSSYNVFYNETKKNNKRSMIRRVYPRTNISKPRTHRQACKECGMDGFCPKPITLPVLKTMISNHCGNIDRNQPHTSTSADSGNGGRGGGGGLEEAEGGKWRPPQRPISGSTLSGNMRDAGGEGEKDTDQVRGGDPPVGP